MNIQIGKEYDFRIKNPGRMPDHCSRVRVVKVDQFATHPDADELIAVYTCRRNDNGAVVVAFEDELFVKL